MVTIACCATCPAGHGSAKLQHEDPGGPLMNSCCASGQVPQTNPFQQSTTTITLLQPPPHPGPEVTVGAGGVSVAVIVMDPVHVRVGERVGVEQIVNVWVIVLVLHGVHDCDSAGGHVIVGVGLIGCAQQIVRSTQEMQ